MTLRNVYLAQVNYQFGRNAFLPYSVGIIQAYCQTILEIKENYKFRDLLFLRNNPKRVACEMERPVVLGLSCYIWNWEYNNALAQAVKSAHPDCLIVFGGPQVPNNSDNFFATHPHVDLLIHFAGEVPFSEILLQALEGTPDYKDVNSLSIRLPDNRSLKTQPRPVSRDLDPIPSPYLTGVFDELIGDERYDFHASQETHRGCPYACTFCDWGAANFSKVGIFPDARLEAELDWFGRKEIELLYNCDANYGILKRDVELTYKLIRTKEKYKFPKSFRAAYAKNSNDRVFEIAKSLNDADLCKGVTLSFQSTNENTLEVIKRTNIKMDDFSSLMKNYREENIPTYSEIILGLPGESYDTFVDGICNLIQNGQHGSINIYPCLVLPNAELNDSDHRIEYEIKTISVPLQAAHSTISKEDVLEYCDVIIATKTMPLNDWRRSYLFGWTIQCFHSMGLTQFLSIYLNSAENLSYRTFYEEFLSYALARPESSSGQQVALISGVVDRVLDGGAWDVQIPQFGNINWPPEEASFLNLVVQKDAFYKEIEGFLRYLITRHELIVDEDILADLLRYQKAVVVDPYTAEKFEIKLFYRIHELFAMAMAGEKPIPVREASGVVMEIHSEAAFGGDIMAYAKEVVWYGRKKVRYLHTNITTSPEVRPTVSRRLVN